MMGPTSNSVRTSSFAERSRATRAQGDRFAKLLKREKSGGSEGAEKGKEPGAGDARLNSALELARYLPTTGLNAASSQGSGEADGLQSSSFGTGLTPELENLTGELGARLEVLAQSSAATELNLTFESQAFAGLRVHLQQAAGEVGIRFMTNSPAISGLLRQHVGTLRETLAQKGVRVRNVTVGGAVTRRLPEKHDDA